MSITCPKCKTNNLLNQTQVCPYCGCNIPEWNEKNEAENNAINEDNKELDSSHTSRALFSFFKERPSVAAFGIGLFVVLCVIIGILCIPKPKIPESTGKSPETVSSEIKGLAKEVTVVLSEEYSDSIDRGLVTRTNPKAGTRIKNNSTVEIYVSKGVQVTIPVCTNMTIDEAESALKALDLNTEADSSIYSETINEGCIVSTEPAAGQTVDQGTTVKMIISKGSEYRDMPDYSEMTLSDLENAFSSIGLSYDIESEFNDEIPSGDLIGCDKNVGDRVSVEEKIKVYVSKGSGVTMPDVIGKSIDNVKASLEKLGFICDIKEEYNDEKAGTVVACNYPEGERLEEGITVKLTVSKGSIEQEYKDECETVSYDELIRKPETYKNKKIKLKVKISDINIDTLLGIEYDRDIMAKYQGELLILEDNRDSKEPGLREGDNITVYGTGNGLCTMKRTTTTTYFGIPTNKEVDTYEVPEVSVKYIDF